MNPIYFLLVFPLLAPFVVLLLTKRNIRDSLLPAAGFSFGCTLALGLIFMAFNGWATRDTETLNGFVTGKEIHKFTCPINTSNPCENGYDCNCHTVTYSCGTDSKGNTQYCTREECDTCYVYPWEQNFWVDSSLQGERAYKISRVDRQGAITPPRWAQVKHGDPVSITHVYTNYILAAADSLFAEDGKAEEKYKAKIPAYPQQIYDYYKMDRVVTVGKVNIDRKLWNESLSRILVQVGPKKQANAIVVIAEGVDMDFANAVRRAWRGFKKNDIVVFAGVDAAGNLKWTRTMSWSKASIVNIKMESEILNRFQDRPLEPVEFINTLKEVSLAHFERRSMQEFEYLKDQASLSGTQITWILIITVLVLCGSVFGFLYLLQAWPFVRRTPDYGIGYYREPQAIRQMRFNEAARRAMRTYNPISRNRSRFRP